MDYFVFADDTFVAEPSRSSMAECIRRIAQLGAVRVVWVSPVDSVGWRQIHKDSPGDVTIAVHVPDEVKLTHMLV